MFTYYMIALFFVVVVIFGYIIYIQEERGKFIFYIYTMSLNILVGVLGGFLLHKKTKHLPLILGLLGGITVFVETLSIPILVYHEVITYGIAKLSLLSTVCAFVIIYGATQGILITIVQNNLKALLSKYDVDTACYLDPVGKPGENRYKAILAEGKYSGAIRGKEFTITEVFDSPRIKEVTPMDNELFLMFREVAVIPKKLHYSTYPRMLEGFVVVGVNGDGKNIDERIIKEVENWW
ncbi:hypothetical protein [Brockia lithotrophica]|nr:hypothetical protein [Brockia lithotrophica]